MDQFWALLAVAGVALAWVGVRRDNRRRARGEVTRLDEAINTVVARDEDAPGHHLLTADEVGAALGYPVVENYANLTAFGGDTQMFEDVAYRRPVLTLALLTGMTAEVGIRKARAEATPLPGLGDEAYLGPGWALTRLGGTHLRLTTNSHQPVEQQAVVDLLRTAASRLT